MLAPRAQQASQARLLLAGLNSLRDSIQARRFPSAAMDAENSSAAQDEPLAPAPAPAPAAATEPEPAPATAVPTAGRRFTRTTPSASATADPNNPRPYRIPKIGGTAPAAATD
eukprot:876015-Pleurochrysis_carterae.AAC.1